MTSNVYTLSELVDIALKTPEIGAVNFNVLRIVLLKILCECKIQNVTAEWTPVTVSTIVKAFDDKKLPDHPVLKSIAEEKQNIETGEFMKLKIKASSKEEKNAVTLLDEKEEKSLVKETKTEINKTEKNLDKEKDDISYESQEEKNVEIPIEKDRTDVITPDNMTPVSTDLESSAETEKSDDGERGENAKSTHRKKSPPEVKSTSSKGMKAGTNLWQMWQIKKLMKRIEGIEEELNHLVGVIDELQELKNLRGKRILFEEGERLQSGYSGPVVEREEFEHTIDELGEALARISMKLKQHKEECSTKNQDIWKEMCLKVSVEDLNRSKEPLSKKLKTLGVAVKNIERIIKEIIYPDSCGITKCMVCRRKAHLSYRPLIIDQKGEAFKEDEEHDQTCNTDENTENGPSGNLRFRKHLLRRNNKMYIGAEKRSSVEEPVKDLEAEESEKLVDPSHIINVETFDIFNMSRSFEPFRRNSIFIPVDRPKQASLTITLENMNQIPFRD